MAKSPSLSQQTAEAITRMIVTERRFRPGDKLPNELDLSQELGVSRITLREGIRVLCTRGMLEIRRGKGTFVVSDDASAGPAPQGPDLSGAGLRDLLEVRMALEPTAAWYAAKRADEEELAALEALLGRMEDAAARGQPFFREERDFLSAVAKASRNRMIRQLLPLLGKAAYTDLTGSRESAAVALQDYRDIVRALKSRSPESARAFSRVHILHTCQFAGQEVE